MKDNKEKTMSYSTKQPSSSNNWLWETSICIKILQKRIKLSSIKTKKIITKNETIKEKDDEIMKLKKKKKKKKNKNFMFVKLQKIIDYNDKIINKS